MSENENVNEKQNIDDFEKIMKDFYRDILTTFPEYKQKLDDKTLDFLMNKNNGLHLFEYCRSVYPERFFDILYQNIEMFTSDDYNTKFLPNIDFKEIWTEDISENTRDVVWKYLQLILFTVSSGLESGESFGDTAKLFEAINEDDLKGKLEETMKQMSDMFENMKTKEDKNTEGDEGENSKNINMDDLPDPEQMKEHINGLLGGKLGRLAHEIAEETAADMNIDMEGSENVNDVFQKLFKNPGRLISMVKNVGEKLDTKLKSGEIKESELMKEASELMEKMKSMPGMKNMDNILSKMGIPVGKNGGGKANINMFQSHMKQNIKKATQKERMLRKLEERRKLREKLGKNVEKKTDGEKKQYNHKIFKTDDEVVKTTRTTVNKKNKKRRKKKKGKK
jgi:hypothetical protein